MKLLKGIGWGLLITLALAALIMAAASAARAADPCPCGTRPPFVCCGDLTCDELRFNAYYWAEMCRTQKTFICCRQNVRGMFTLESVTPATPDHPQQCGPLHTASGYEVQGVAFRLMEMGRGGPTMFTGLRDGVTVQQRVYSVAVGEDGEPFVVDADGPGKLVRTGRFAGGIVTWDNGERHRVAGGELFRVEP